MDCLRWGEGHSDIPPRSLCACGFPGSPHHPEVPHDLRDDGAGWPWYEARLSIHVHHAALPPGDVFGVGGDELVHARVTTQAPSFVDAVSKLDGELGVRWNQIIKSAPLVDQEPSVPPVPSGSFVPAPTSDELKEAFEKRWAAAHPSRGASRRAGEERPVRDPWQVAMWAGIGGAIVFSLFVWAVLWLVFYR